MTHLHKEDYKVVSVPLRTCREMVEKWHYTQGGSNTATFRHGLLRLRPNPAFVGCAWWIPPTKSAAAAWWPNWRAVLVLHRLVVAPGEPTNAASYLIGRSIRLIRRDPRWEYLLTYADEGQGHDGLIYRATNWTYLGMTAPEAQWVDRDGRYVSRKAGPRTRTKAEMEELGYRMIGRFRKHRYGMEL